MYFIIFTNNVIFVFYILWGRYDLLRCLKEYALIHNITDKSLYYVLNAKHITHVTLIVIINF